MTATILTLGTFDLFHSGHVDLLSNCRKLAGSGPVVVALNRDEFVARFKPAPPVLTYAERFAVLAACRYVDLVVPNSQRAAGSSAAGIIEMISPDIIAVGSDWRDRRYLDQLGVTASWLESVGTQVVYINRPDPQLISSRAITERIFLRTLQQIGAEDRQELRRVILERLAR